MHEVARNHFMHAKFGLDRGGARELEEHRIEIDMAHEFLLGAADATPVDEGAADALADADGEADADADALEAELGFSFFSSQATATSA
jgi:hypothetical protein